ncbi:HAD-IIIC family phosphatase [Labedaea rhizosphaerae]|uniref:D-glyceryl-ACP synthase n=1 Tax=Labedaea rhizosphaerae TaxID=598644 RepID=A0A4R6S359_LABRH|nr:HAD-IIIC family phosphatase [Labedaea rhizosphaerae]TDP94050.1 D-glyceryl-ACP synthase [Labedaea rhizosphaerae]
MTTIGETLTGADLLAALRQSLSDAEQGGVPGPALRTALLRCDDPLVLRKAAKTLAKLPLDNGLRAAKVCIQATCTIGSFAPLLRAQLVGAGIAPELESGPYGRFELTMATADFSEHDVVACLLDESYFLPDEWDTLDPAGLGKHVRARLEELRGILLGAVERSSTSFVLHTLPLPAQVRDSFISWSGRAAVSQAWHRLNADLLALAEESRQLAVVDLVGILADQAVAARDDRMFRYGDMPYTDDALLALAKQVRRFTQAKLGLSRKVLALDLDNTLWGGVLGEVGAAGVQLGGLYPGNCYTQLQRTAQRLREQGVILVLASKNDAELVSEALREHPEMLLREDAFSATAVNWASKAGNIEAAAESLSLNTNSFVFLDDSPFERGHVADELPEVAVLAADGDPANVVRTLLRDGWFDVLELTDTDLKRPELYRTRAKRADFAGGFGSSEDYLAALEIRLAAEEATSYTIGRIAQLGGRSNQFNLTGIRPDEAETKRLAESDDHLVASFAVRDRFGDEGIIGATWVECGADRWDVTNFVLSCRVLGRGVEIAAVHWIADKARAAGAKTLRGRFVPSGRNNICADLWTRSGFTEIEDGVFELDLGADAEGASRSPRWIIVNGEDA